MDQHFYSGVFFACFTMRRLAVMPFQVFCLVSTLLLLENNRCSLDAYQIQPLVHIRHSISA